MKEKRKNMENKDKINIIKNLKTDIVMKKNEKKKYLTISIIAFIGIILTFLIQSIYLKDNNIFNKRLNSNNIVGLAEADKDKYPHLPEGFTAVNKTSSNFEIVKDPYNSENIGKWNKDFYAVDKGNMLWRWIGAFKYRTEYFKDGKLLGTAVGSAVHNAEGQEVDSKEFENLIKDATHYSYTVKDIKDNDPTYEIHPAFTKIGFVSSGFWVGLTTQEIDPQKDTKLDTYGKIYSAVKNTYSGQENKSEINPDLSAVNIINNYEYGAINILKQTSIFSEELGNEQKNEVILGYLEGGVDTNAKELIADYKASNLSSLTVYPKGREDTPEKNYEKAMLSRGMYGDGISETRGLLDKNANKKALDTTKFLTTNNPFLIMNKTKNGITFSAINGTLPKDAKTNIRLVINKKPNKLENKVEHIFSAEEGYFLTNDGRRGSEIKYTNTKGSLITDEKLQKNILPVKRNGYKFIKWEPDPTGNIYYESQRFTPVWEKESGDSTNPGTNPDSGSEEPGKEKYAIARFYHLSDKSKYTDIKVKLGTKLNSKQVEEVIDKIYKESGKKEHVVTEWTPNPLEAEFNTEGIKEFIPTIEADPSKDPDFDKELYKYITFTFYKNADKNDWVVLNYKYLKDDAEQFNGVSPKELPDYEEKMIALSPSDGTDSDYIWEPDINVKRIESQEYIPKFIPKKPPEPKIENIKFYVNYNGSILSPNVQSYTVPKGTILSKSDDKYIQIIYNEMTSNSHMKRNYELPEDKSKWYNRSLDEPINEEVTFKLNWQRVEITVRFWDSPEDNPSKKVIKEETIPAGAKVTLPDDSLVLPFYERVNPNTGYKVKRTFNKIDGWKPKSVYDPIFENDLNMKKENGKRVLDIYPIFESDYGTKYDKVTITWDLNIPSGEEGNIYFPDREAFKDKEHYKDAYFYAPRESDYPRIPGYSLKGFSPELPAKISKNTTIKLIWQKNNPYSPVNPGPGNTVNPDFFKPETPNVPSDIVEPGKDEKKRGEIEINDLKVNTNKPETKVNVDAGLKISKNFIIIGSILTSVIIFSYVKIVNLNKEVERNKNVLKDLNNIF